MIASVIAGETAVVAGAVVVAETAAVMRRSGSGRNVAAAGAAMAAGTAEFEIVHKGAYVGETVQGNYLGRRETRVAQERHRRDERAFA